MRKISTEIGSLARFVGEEEAVEMVARAGFDAFDLSMFCMARYDWQNKCALPSDHPFAGKDHLAYARHLGEIARKNGIVCNQAHAPFPVCAPEIMALQERALACTAAAGGPLCVIHPDNDKTPAENAEMYRALLPTARALGVKIATENMFNWSRERNESLPAACSSAEDFVAHIDAVDDPYFVACLDLGHAEMRGAGGGAVTMIRALGPRLQALHIHDNDRWHDSHRLPFTMDIDFDAITAALREIGYAGDVTLEADTYLASLGADRLEEGLANMAAAARRFAAMLEG